MSDDREPMPMEQVREGLVLLLRTISDEVHDPSWTPTAAQIEDLHHRLAEPFHSWLRAVARHP
jgi:hypothetical protein